jgi:hypothetical protein
VSSENQPARSEPPTVRATAYRRAQANEILLRFRDAHGLFPRSDDEFHAWASEHIDRWEKPVKPRAEAYHVVVTHP